MPGAAAGRERGRRPRIFGDALIANSTHPPITDRRDSRIGSDWSSRLHTLFPSFPLTMVRSCSLSYHLQLTRTGPPHNNASRLLRRSNNRPRCLRIVSSSRRVAEICSCQPRWRRQRWRLLVFEHHHGRSLPDPERGSRKDGKY